jgi:PST family polysaccharide transporter
VLGNALLVYGAQAARLLAPIVVLPFVARRLDLAVFGALAAAQALAYLVMIIPEYGFAQTGPRALATRRGDAAALAAETGRILSAKLLLCAPALAAALVAGFLVPTLGGDPWIVAGMALLGLALGMGPGWYFQGIGEARRYAALEIAGLAVFVALVVFAPYGSTDAAAILFFQAAGLLLAVGVGHRLMLRERGFQAPTARGVASAIAESFALFLNKLASNGPGLGLVTIIGFRLPPEQVALYAAAERLVMGSANALWPVMQVLLPEIADRRRRDPAAALILVRRGTLALVAIGCALAGVLVVFAGPIVGLLFGPAFAPTVEMLRLAAFALPAIALTNALGNGVLVATGRDWSLTLLTIAMAGLSAALALAFVWPGSLDRVAAIRLGVEVITSLAMLALAMLALRGGGWTRGP